MVSIGISPRPVHAVLHWSPGLKDSDQPSIVSMTSLTVLMSTEYRLESQRSVAEDNWASKSQTRRARDFSTVSTRYPTLRPAKSPPLLGTDEEYRQPSSSSVRAEARLDSAVSAGLAQVHREDTETLGVEGVFYHHQYQKQSLRTSFASL